MTMHLPGYEPPRRRRNGVATIHEDIHVHVGYPDLRAAVADPPAYRPWLPPAISRFEADSEGVRFRLDLPGRGEHCDLHRQPTEHPREVVFTRNESGSIERLTWALHPEGQRECHLTVELVYQPARGLFGGALETLFYRAQRTQALRDLLWALKREIEQAQRDAEAGETSVQSATRAI